MHYSLIPLVFLEIIILMIQLCSTSSGLTIDMTAANLVPSNQVASVRGRRSLGHDSSQRRQLRRGDFQHGGLSHSEFHIGRNQRYKRQVYNVFHYLHFMNLNISMVFPLTYKIYNAAQERRRLLRRGQQWQHHHRRRPSHRARHLAGHAHADVRRPRRRGRGLAGHAHADVSRPRHRGRSLAGHAHADVRRDMRVIVN